MTTPKIVYHDRYTATGAPYPDDDGCKGPCEGMGFYPSNDPKEWPPGAVPDEIGYVFITCERCKGSRKEPTP